MAVVFTSLNPNARSFFPQAFAIPVALPLPAPPSYHTAAAPPPPPPLPYYYSATPLQPPPAEYTGLPFYFSYSTSYVLNEQFWAVGAAVPTKPPPLFEATRKEAAVPVKEASRPPAHSRKKGGQSSSRSPSKGVNGGGGVVLQGNGYCGNYLEGWSKGPPVVRCLRRNLRPQYSSSEKFEFDTAGGDGGSHDWRTTVMIKNIPNKYTRGMLLELLDKHCDDVNKGLEAESHQEKDEKLRSEYDFFYLPIDFGTRCNLGYAFVNFTSPIAAWRLHRCLHRRSWPLFGSSKICEVTYARIQGVMGLKEHFEGAEFFCSSDDMLPVLFRPSRSGSGSTCKQTLVGKRVPMLLLPPAAPFGPFR